MHVAGRRCLPKILVGIVKEKFRFKDVTAEGMLILKCKLQKYGVRCWNRLK
jgi:hypothetical protein